MEEQQEHGSNVLSPELKAKLIEAYDQGTVKTASELTVLVERIAGPYLAAQAAKFLAAHRMRKAAAAKGVRIGV